MTYKVTYKTLLVESEFSGVIKEDTLAVTYHPNLNGRLSLQ